MTFRRSLTVLLACGVAAGMWAGTSASADQQGQGQTWLSLAQSVQTQPAVGELPVAAEPLREPPPQEAKQPPPADANWWVGHTIDGTGGGQIVPTAYMIHPKAVHYKVFGNPAASLSAWGHCGRKNLLTFAVSEVLFERIELSYAVNRLDTGNLPHVIRKTTGGRMGERNIVLHNWNIRGLMLEEEALGLPLPAITGGAHFKYNQTVDDVNDRLGNALGAVGYERSNGVEFTLFATKSLNIKPLPRIVVTAGARNSDAADNGFAGFGDHRATTLEAAVQVFPTDRMYFGFEFRRRQRQFSEMAAPRILEGEENWYGLTNGLMINDNLSLSGGLLFLGNMANQPDACLLTIQLRYAI